MKGLPSIPRREDNTLSGARIDFISVILNQLTTLANMGRVSCVNLTELTEAVATVNQSLSSLLERKRWSDGNG